LNQATARDALVDRNLGVVAEQLSRLRQVGDVVSDLAEERFADLAARLVG